MPGVHAAYMCVASANHSWQRWQCWRWQCWHESIAGAPCVQVGIPQHVAQVLTYPQRVTDHNIETLRRAVANGAPACILRAGWGMTAHTPCTCCPARIKLIDGRARSQACRRVGSQVLRMKL